MANRLVIYITPQNGEGIPEVWKDINPIESGTVPIPVNLFARDVVIDLEFEHVKGDDD